MSSISITVITRKEVKISMGEWGFSDLVNIWREYTKSLRNTEYQEYHLDSTI